MIFHSNMQTEKKKMKKRSNTVSERTRLIRKAGIIGILVNVIFAFIKLIVGLVANSIAIISDAMNNFTDAFSSIITLIGLKLSQHAPNHKHPLGYGRIEYIAGMIVSVIVLVTGIEFLGASIIRIISPQETDFQTVQFIILGITILGKIGLSRLDLVVGRKTESDSLVASGIEARADVFVSTLAVISAIISKYTDLQIDGWAGALLALFIIFNGIMLIRETLSKIIGERPEKEISDKIKAETLKFGHIIGAHDLVLHNYGPTVKIGSLNLEIPDYVSMEEACEVANAAQKYIYEKYNIYLTFGLYSVNTYDAEIGKIRDEITEMVISFPGAMSIHNFYYNVDRNLFRFEVTVTFSTKDFAGFRALITEEIQRKYPDSQVDIKLGLDFS